MLRVFHHYFSAKKLTFFLAESSAIALACVMGAAACAALFAPEGTHTPLSQLWPTLLWMGAAFVITFQFTLYLLDLYDLRVAAEDRVRGYRFLKAAGVTAMVAGGVMLVTPLVVPMQLPPGTLLGGAMGALAGTLMVRVSIRALVGAPHSVLIVGEGPKARAVASAIDAGGEGTYRIVGLTDPRTSGEALEETAARLNAAYVVQAADDMRGANWVDGLLRCRLQGRRVYEATGFCERVLRRIPVQFLRASDFAFADELTVSPLRRTLKRGFDIAVASLLLMLSAPFLLLVVVAIKLDSKGPIFYRQERTGLFGSTYHLWKFRSMRTDAEKHGAVWAKANDDRVTRVGRFIRRARIDEIPQVFNILTGDMSFVGPRPERPVFVEQLKEQIPFYGLREAVKPGLTGWAQIRYPYGASVEDARNKLEFDLYYVKNGSLFLDVGIIFHTVRHVLLGRGAR
ncbi:bacterial sugar transferase [Myxococcus xanthus DK 1622]|uniref:Bacterial sugar transferase n=1 Tax=Myxococcus xanthus (strain DK1622) TaxID=246197 RepID=Q1D7E5_MYXXD|nr:MULTISPECIES: polyisoprenyl-phosphate hexose-1-phosphate transferase ExoE [Myxococcus]ABF88433.1 bacterial sugar transferase [Myxococcus xanthus DK 1622]NOJ55743.1 sugar transferase [Myxococcus xanthus]QPM82674.1 sugar transferase [Myxococcus xanthus]QVW64979.1 sugar transferase [Myxococcus xanthus DZ2]UEO01951.1 polyisoprenyl-phosphate hexose-1-phosphate transferase ExoE [Myxococcus xanthus DZ2]